jgi:hypothetical protein
MDVVLPFSDEAESSESCASQARATILRLSVEKLDSKKAFAEWDYTGFCEDLGEPMETCQLCAYQGIRYQFEIKNRLNENKLLIGSRCITRFGIGGEETAATVTKHQNTMVEAARNRAVIAHLDALIAIAPDPSFMVSVKTRYERESYFTPRTLICVLAALKAAGMPWSPNIFKVYLRTNKARAQVWAASLAQYQDLYACMDSGQRKKYLPEEYERIHAKHVKAAQAKLAALEAFKAQQEAYRLQNAQDEAAEALERAKAQPAPTAQPVVRVISPPREKLPSSAFKASGMFHSNCPVCGKDTFGTPIRKTEYGWVHIGECLMGRVARGD